MNASAETRGHLQHLAARAQLGDRASLELLLRQLQDPLRAHIMGIVGDGDVASDVLQETLLLICRHLDKLEDVRWVRAWAYRIATREAVRAARKSSERQHESIDDAQLAADAATVTPDALFDEDLLTELPRRISSLPAGAQVALRMHYLDAMSQAEIAEALEIPLGTVKSRIAYGLQCLRRDWPVSESASG